MANRVWAFMNHEFMHHALVQMGLPIMVRGITGTIQWYRDLVCRDQPIS